LRNISKKEVYKIKVIPRARKDLDKVRGKIFEQIKNKILALAVVPRPRGSEKLTRKEGYRIRVGNLRILYRIDDKKKEIFVYRIRHRKDVYRGL
jgi:mRNA interferase RelE/StbE